jgi:hypothetical protein
VLKQGRAESVGLSLRWVMRHQRADAAAKCWAVNDPVSFTCRGRMCCFIKIDITCVGCSALGLIGVHSPSCACIELTCRCLLKMLA